jgi:hypothetical protein
LNTKGKNMRELNEQEVEEVSGGLSVVEGGILITTIGLGALSGPIAIGALAMGLGLTMLVGGTAVDEGYCS